MTHPTIPFIDLKSQFSALEPQIRERMDRVLAHGQYILGPEVTELEEQLADFVGVTHCYGVASGTDALQIALMALGVGPGDEVITVPYTWISSAETIALVGARPVFVDIQPDTWNMDPTQLEAAITERTRAIMPVGIYGQPADMAAVNAIADRHGLLVVEDAAQSLGSTHHGKRAGGLGTIGCTSFFPSKPLGCYGDGGALFTDNPDLAQRMKQIRNHGQAKKHHHPILGINARLDTLQAAVLLAKLEVFDQEIDQRQTVASHYARALSGSSIKAPQVANSNTSVWAQYTVLSDDREALKERLKAEGIPSVNYYAVPMHRQPVFADLGYQAGDFPVSEHVADHCLSLPMSPALTASQIDHITSTLVARAD
ncbi:DegT/DnrJ/EryC1/StrS family aminotransferase [Spiribacter vilamensis]|uniref:UDP-2-acetamido-2-deoxy-ribo-hexuluronate aminotransferase n=1 Tax=Spiribacter vilamensis TaxID=531306 RepID=A0A4Q8D2H2_9GAMM|nr:DegT/DnrJ/EryC1/StrS family aminotransferase [Spiribacter vilamensis]RZU99589.1 UDP-2-acetamido-2-deoxy-ribo-hexuluronate aminotransferase [Spiribacter vilamensis]TVO61444.1 DegT/DnrJ/EryC1/StrS family aminotransferase [Spiribacter vilamensis]